MGDVVMESRYCTKDWSTLQLLKAYAAATADIDPASGAAACAWADGARQCTLAAWEAAEVLEAAALVVALVPVPEKRRLEISVHQHRRRSSQSDLRCLVVCNLRFGVHARSSTSRSVLGGSVWKAINILCRSQLTTKVVDLPMPTAVQL